MKQLHGYSDGCTHSGFIVMIGERGIAAATSLSILLEVSGYHTGGMTWRKPLSLPIQHTYLEVVGSNPVTNKKISAHKSRVEVAACSRLHESSWV